MENMGQVAEKYFECQHKRKDSVTCWTINGELYANHW